MYSVGPVFEGMPMMRFGEKRIDWNYLSSQLNNMYAPKLPFSYLNDKRGEIYEDKMKNSIDRWLLAISEKQKEKDSPFAKSLTSSPMLRKKNSK